MAPGTSPVIAIQGRVLRITFENEKTGYRVLRVELPSREVLTVVGLLPPVGIDVEIRVIGRRVHDAKHGEQLVAESASVLTPTTREGLVRYLGSGLVRGVGPKLAERIVEKFGDASLAELDGGAVHLHEVRGINHALAASIAEAWKAQRGASDALVFLRGQEVPPGLAARIFKKYGSATEHVVRDNPYRLAHEVSGVGFLRADQIAQSMGIARDAPHRLEAGVVHSLFTINEEGHCFALRWELASRAAEQLGVAVEQVEAAIDRGIQGGALVSEELHEGVAIFPKPLFQAEIEVAARLQKLLSRAAPLVADVDPLLDRWETQVGVRLAAAQRQAVHTAAREKVMVLTGGPGVGKTTVVRALLELLRAARLQTRLAAPTGRASKRMSEATGAEACTLHRLLEIDPRTGRFLRNKEHPLELQALIVDESSMIDLLLARALLEALPSSARLIFVGDVDQLPSVGPGMVLADLIASGTIPVVRLTAVFRQGEGSLIVENAHRILHGESPISAQGSQGEFYVIEQRDPGVACQTIRELVHARIPARFGLDPKRDVQVLSPMNKSLTGVRALNETLQDALNTDGAPQGRGFRIGDKVMQLRNDYERDVYNGDVGIIERGENKGHALWVRIDGRLIEYDEAAQGDLTLAYAMSIHKSQGSEYPAVIVPWQRQHFVMLSRNLLYTAVTRGKRLVVLVADRYSLRLGLAEERKTERRTRLASRLASAGKP